MRQVPVGIVKCPSDHDPAVRLPSSARTRPPEDSRQPCEAVDANQQDVGSQFSNHELGKSPVAKVMFGGLDKGELLPRLWRFTPSCSKLGRSHKVLDMIHMVITIQPTYPARCAERWR